ncbi:hypothetical protein [Ammoniphilus sp. 3BR4]|uniref:hypothetical protein n=1 Tax=Ammoniphilus sp. 3BR4 TaxID=3158265 RepID=UPI00346795E9
MESNEKMMDQCIRWLEKEVGCEVYFIHNEEKTNGFAEYRNGGHIIYVIGNKEKISAKSFLEILTHEAGHVLYNKRKMKEGTEYDTIVKKTQEKLMCFDRLLQEQIITDEEYDRFYQAMEEEWESEREKEKLLKRLESELLT